MSEEKKKKSRYVDAETWQSRTAKAEKRVVENEKPTWDEGGENVTVNDGKIKGSVIVISGLVCLLLLGGIVFALMNAGKGKKEEVVLEGKPTSELVSKSVEESEDDFDIEVFLSQSKKLVDQFLNESDPQKRLAFVDHVDGLRERMKSYPEEALISPGNSVVFDRSFEVNEIRIFRYLVHFDDRKWRVLLVLLTDDGLKIDWDSYARHSTVSWEDFKEGEVDESEFRVVASKGSYFNPPFDDSNKWNCYLVESPDLSGWCYVYGEKGSDHDVELRSALGHEEEAKVLTIDVEKKAELAFSAPMNSDVQVVKKKKEVKKAVIIKIKRHSNSFGEVLYSLEDFVSTGWLKR